MYLIMVLSGTGVLWFIQVLWLFCLLLAVIRKFEKGKILSGLVLNTPVITVYRFGIYGLYFFSVILCLLTTK